MSCGTWDPLLGSEAPVRHGAKARATLDTMESKLANEAKLALLAAARRLTPEQRLNAFLAHSQLMMELHAAGQKLRAAQQNVRK
jgi:hypothetical protein